VDAHRVIIVPAAEEDLRAIIAYVRADSLQQAINLAETFAEAVQSLAIFPNRGGVAPESESWGLQVRTLVVFRYCVLYTVNSKGVFILRIVHGHMARPVTRVR
jgi:plasmid stabilization system protein ParE